LFIAWYWQCLFGFVFFCLLHNKSSPPPQAADFDALVLINRQANFSKTRTHC
jgi:hypothetical protein